MLYQDENFELENDKGGQIGSGMINTKFSKELPNLVFIANDVILGDDIRAVILSLVNEFNKIASINLKHNLELSQYYAVGKNLIRKDGTPYCTNCELVLKYTDIAVCIIDGRIGQNIIERDNRYYEMGENGEKEVKCDFGRGVVKFYIKQIDDCNVKYIPIKISRIITVESLEPFTEALYHHNEKISEIEEATAAAIGVGQSSAVKMMAGKGEFRTTTVENVDNVINNVNRIFDKAKIVSFKPQISRFRNYRVLSTVPDKETVNIADTIAKNISKRTEFRKKDLSTILVPGNNPIFLEIKKFNNDSNKKEQIAVPVEANVAIVPTQNILKDPSVVVTKPSIESQSAKENKLSKLASSAIQKVEATTSIIAKKVEETIGKLGDYLRGKTTKVTPVSKDLSVMTPIRKPEEEIEKKVPVPQDSSEKIKYPITFHSEKEGTDLSDKSIYSSKKLVPKNGTENKTSSQMTNITIEPISESEIKETLEFSNNKTSNF